MGTINQARGGVGGVEAAEVSRSRVTSRDGLGLRGGTGVEVVAVGTIETRIGPFGAAVSPIGLGRLTFPMEPFDLCEAWARRFWPAARVVRGGRALAAARAELSAYLEGRLRAFATAVDLRGTPFQTRVWCAVARIPYGTTRAYAEVAAAIGCPRAVRAVGAANGANPVPIVVPCHRIIGADSRLTGYGGGLALKERLLALEGVTLELPDHP